MRSAGELTMRFSVIPAVVVNVTGSRLAEVGESHSPRRWYVSIVDSREPASTSRKRSVTRATTNDLMAKEIVQSPDVRRG